ncbi:MAG TPA: MlaD family protein [Pirellulales bacterium]|nr:MlaD family protein [Pirellulales bacterium]
MDERVVQFRVGVMVLATAIITAILVVLFGKLPSLVRGTYTVYVQFQDASGVAQDTPVRESGILVGRVAKTDLNDQGVLVTLHIHSDVVLTQREAIRASTPLLGDTVLQVVKQADPAKPATPLHSGDFIAGAPSPDVYKIANDLEHEMLSTMRGLNNASSKVEILAGNVNNLLEQNDEQFTRIIAKTERAMDSFQRAMSSIDDLVSDEQTKADLKRSIAALPKLLADTERTINSVQDTVLAAKDTVNTANQNLKNLEGFTEPLSQRGGEIVKNMDQGVAHLEDLLKQLSIFTRNLNNSDGTLAQLVNNPQLYQQLVQAAENVNSVTRELKPIIRDARVISDKVARHPGVILRDAIVPQPGIKGVSPRGYWDLEKPCEVYDLDQGKLIVDAPH